MSNDGSVDICDCACLLHRVESGAMAGTLEVSSEEGVGKTFHVELPVGHEDSTLLAAEHIFESLSKVTVHKKVTWELPQSRVLVVDDGPENRQLISVIPDDLKLSVELAENGKEGLDAAVAVMQAEPYDLIIMDIQMPVMDGYEAVSEMRKAGVETPIVALTANTMKGFVSGIIAAGFSHFRVKPLDMDLLGELLARLLVGTRRELDDDAIEDQAPQVATVTAVTADDFAGAELVFTGQVLAGWHMTLVRDAAS